MNNPVNCFDVNGNWSFPNWQKVTVGAVSIAGGASGAVMEAIRYDVSRGWQDALDGACSEFMSGGLIGSAT